MLTWSENHLRASFSLWSGFGSCVMIFWAVSSARLLNVLLIAWQCKWFWVNVTISTFLGYMVYALLSTLPSGHCSDDVLTKVHVFFSLFLLRRSVVFWNQVDALSLWLSPSLTSGSHCTPGQSTAGPSDIRTTATASTISCTCSPKGRSLAKRTLPWNRGCGLRQRPRPLPLSSFRKLNLRTSLPT